MSPTVTESDNRVIVSGCGPVGAVMTLALVRKGIPVTLIEQLPDAAEDQRAATIHTPTVEMLVDLGLEKEMFSDAPSGGMQAPLFHFRDRATGELIAVFDISVLKGEVPYPYVVQWEQYKLVHAALPHIKASGLGEVRFSAKLIGLTQTQTTSRRRSPTAPAKPKNSAADISSAQTAAQARYAVLPKSFSRVSPGPSASSRSAPVSISAPSAKDFARAIISSIPMNGSICSRSRAMGRPESGAASFRFRSRKPTSRR